MRPDDTTELSAGFQSIDDVIEFREMSQYPSPYNPPNVQPSYMPYGGAPDVLAPARRASLLMFILGPLLMTCGGCVMSIPMMFSVMPQDRIQPLLDQIQTAYHTSASVVLPILGTIILLPGLSLLILAFFVRRGGKISAILASIVVSLVLLKSIVELAVCVRNPTDPNSIGAMIIDLVSLGIFGLLFFWLIKAIRGSSTVNQAQQQYLAQYWQYQQSMQAHTGYGYAAPPQEGQNYSGPPPIPAFAPPPPPPASTGQVENDTTPPPPTVG